MGTRVKDQQDSVARLRSLLVRSRVAIENLNAEIARLNRLLAEERARRQVAERNATHERVAVLTGTLSVILERLSRDHLFHPIRKEMEREPWFALAYQRLRPEGSLAELEGEAPERPAREASIVHLQPYGLHQRLINILDKYFEARSLARRAMTIADLLATPQEQLCACREFGERSLATVHQALRRAGHLGPEEELPHEA